MIAPLPPDPEKVRKARFESLRRKISLAQTILSARAPVREAMLDPRMSASMRDALDAYAEARIEAFIGRRSPRVLPRRSR